LKLQIVFAKYHFKFKILPNTAQNSKITNPSFNFANEKSFSDANHLQTILSSKITTTQTERREVNEAIIFKLYLLDKKQITLTIPRQVGVK
jgi:hypothetical protein